MESWTWTCCYRDVRRDMLRSWKEGDESQTEQHKRHAKTAMAAGSWHVHKSIILRRRGHESYDT